MAKSQANCNENEVNMSMDNRTKPGGYITSQLLDEINMASANIERHLQALTGVNTTKEEIYRLISLITIENGQIQKAYTNLKLIFK